MSKFFILHGWTYYAHETWKPLLALLDERDIRYEFLSIPGLTDGTNPVWTIDDYVKWLKEKVGDERVILYGHSHGGRISLAFTAKYPQLVERLILEDSAGIPPRGWQKLKRDVFRKLSQAGHLFTNSETIRNLLYRIIRENDYRLATPEMKKTLASVVAADLRPVLGSIACPTLIVWGAKDATTPLYAGKIIHEGIRGSRLHIIPDARHSPHITHPKEVADLIQQEIA